MTAPKEDTRISTGDTRIPTRILACIVRDAVDAAVLGHVDGRATIHALAAVTSLPEQTVTASLERLEKSGVIAFLPPSSGPQARLTGPAGPARVSSIQLAALKFPAGEPEPPSPSSVPPERAERVELRDDQRAHIDAIYALCKVGNHYEVLGIELGANRKVVKSAFFALAATFHPDRFFRKPLGSYKHRVETIFRRISEAYETLGAKDLRAAYDARLQRGRARMDSIDLLLEEAIDELRGSSAAALREQRAAMPPIEVEGAQEPARKV